MRILPLLTAVFIAFACSSQNLHLKDSMYTMVNGEKVYKRVQFKPEFPGGKDSLLSFFDRNLKIPGEKKEGGSVTVSFIVDKQGQIKDPKILKGIPGHPDYDMEALRVVAMMPVWIPAVHLGKKVSCLFTMPISFVVDKATGRN